MKIITIKLDHDNKNYDNCLKRSLVFGIKQEADIIAFTGVRRGSYQVITDYYKDYHFELDSGMKKSEPHGEVLLVRERFRDFEYQDKASIYYYKDRVVAIGDFDPSECVFPNGNPKPAILIGRESVGYRVENSSTKEVPFSKYPVSVTELSSDTTN